MKKLFTLSVVLLFTAFSFVSKAQLVLHYTSNVVSGDPSTLLEGDAKIINTSNASIIFKVVRTNISLASGHNSYFCVGVNCYTPAVFVSSAFTLAPGDSNNLITYADPAGVNGTDEVSYRVYDTNDSANDKASVDFTYDFATGINVLNAQSSNYMICSQSNTDNVTNITYNLNNFRDGKLVIRNLLGSVVKEIMLTDKQGNVMVSTSELPSGIYMYFLVNNDEPVATKKMVISHR